MAFQKLDSGAVTGAFGDDVAGSAFAYQTLAANIRQAHSDRVPAVSTAWIDGEEILVHSDPAEWVAFPLVYWACAGVTSANITIRYRVATAENEPVYWQVETGERLTAFRDNPDVYRTLSPAASYASDTFGPVRLRPSSWNVIWIWFRSRVADASFSSGLTATIFGGSIISVGAFGALSTVPRVAARMHYRQSGAATDLDILGPFLLGRIQSADEAIPVTPVLRDVLNGAGHQIDLHRTGNLSLRCVIVRPIAETTGAWERNLRPRMAPLQQSYMPQLYLLRTLQEARVGMYRAAANRSSSTQVWRLLAVPAAYTTLVSSDIASRTTDSAGFRAVALVAVVRNIQGRPETVITSRLRITNRDGTGAVNGTAVDHRTQTIYGYADNQRLGRDVWMTQRFSGGWAYDGLVRRDSVRAVNVIRPLVLADTSAVPKRIDLQLVRKTAEDTGEIVLLSWGLAESAVTVT